DPQVEIVPPAATQVRMQSPDSGWSSMRNNHWQEYNNQPGSNQPGSTGANAWSNRGATAPAGQPSTAHSPYLPPSGQALPATAASSPDRALGNIPSNPAYSRPAPSYATPPASYASPSNVAPAAAPYSPPAQPAFD